MATPEAREKIGHAFDYFETLEGQYFDSLSTADRQKLCAGEDKSVAEIIKQMSLVGELLLLLVGIKPCVLIHVYKCPDYARGIVERAFRPFLEATKIDGIEMELHEITHEMRTTSYTLTAGQPERHTGFKGGWILANRKHPRYSHVRRTFYEAKEYTVIAEAVGLALGYPGTYEALEDEPFKVRVFYNGKRVGSDAPQKHYLEYDVHPSEMKCGEWHFECCQMACEGIVELEVDFPDYNIDDSDGEDDEDEDEDGDEDDDGYDDDDELF
ncbi:unnamed protein product [Vitrella brassicaformis CCMP3155]|uniref:Uncharacterized protein n=2 Tax=Vitrella brassicaformis TaxID=1169539 RepID=A0A0G4G4M7_VITBC|nr:unnamed protein product [Vitrella brassicaformis CCMP3155]|eukprot:CEM22943.1 unnamed protein product [Vitrella brassicaformis CCMP3155]